MDDLISRQAAIDALRNINTIVRPISESDDVFLIDKAEAMTELMMLPSAQPDIARSIATIIENEKDMRVILTSVNQCKDD